MKTICIFNGYYIPAKNYGGPLTSIKNVVDTCYKKYDFYIVCTNHDLNSSTPFNVPTNIWVKVGHANVMYLQGTHLDYSIKGMELFLSSVKPDIVWFTGILKPRKKIVCAYVAKKLGIPVLISPRGELNSDRVAIKAYKKRPYLALLKTSRLYKKCFFHSTCPDETKGIIRFFDPKPTHIFEVPNIPLVKQPPISSHKKLEGTVRLFFVSRIHPVKNLLFAIDVVKKCRSKVFFDIYGPIEDNAYWEQCKEAIKDCPDNVSINYNGYLSHDELPIVIQEHDCLLFPTINENFGHVIAETLANSRPVIISCNTTPWDDVNNVAGFAVSMNAPSKFSEIIDLISAMDAHTFSKLIFETSNYYDHSPLINSGINGHISMFDAIIDAYANGER